MKRTLLWTLLVSLVITLLLAGCNTGSYADFAPAGAAAATTGTATVDASLQTMPVKYYQVRNGDQWGRLAVTCQIGEDTLLDLNRLHGRRVRLWIGDTIVVPANCPVDTSAPPATAVPTQPWLTFARTYKVQLGDTLAHIARQYANVNVQDIIAVNHLDGDRIYAGQTLCIPPAGRLTWCEKWYSQHNP